MTDQPQPPDLDAIQTRHHLAIDPAACGTCRRLATAGKTPEHPQCAHRATLLPAPDAPCWEALLDIPEDQRAALHSIESDADRASRKGYDLDAEDIRTTAHNALNPVAVSGA